MLNIEKLKAPVYSLFKTDNTFIQYFENGLSPNEARHFHESKLLLQENSCSLLANAALNPTKRHIYYLHDEWRKKKLVPLIPLYLCYKKKYLHMPK